MKALMLVMLISILACVGFGQDFEDMPADTGYYPPPIYYPPDSLEDPESSEDTYTEALPRAINLRGHLRTWNGKSLRGDTWYCGTNAWDRDGAFWKTYIGNDKWYRRYRDTLKLNTIRLALYRYPLGYSGSYSRTVNSTTRDNSYTNVRFMGTWTTATWAAAGKDTVFQANNFVLYNGRWYSCLKGHKPSTVSATSPPTPTNTTYWSTTSKAVPAWDNKGAWPGQSYDEFGTTVDRERAQRIIDTVVAKAARFGLYVIIDHHTVGGTDTAKCEAFWNWVAPRYAGFSHVMYEIANEPLASNSTGYGMLNSNWYYNQWKWSTVRGNVWGQSVPPLPLDSCVTAPTSAKNGWGWRWHKKMIRRLQSLAPSTMVIMHMNSMWNRSHSGPLSNPTHLMKFLATTWNKDSINTSKAALGFHGYVSWETPSTSVSKTAGTIRGGRDSIAYIAKLASTPGTWLYNLTGGQLGLFINEHAIGAAATYSMAYATANKRQLVDWFRTEFAAKYTIRRASTTSIPTGGLSPVILRDSAYAGKGYENIGHDPAGSQGISWIAQSMTMYGTVPIPSWGQTLIDSGCITWQATPLPADIGGSLTDAWAVDDSYKLVSHFVGSKNDSIKLSEYRNAVWKDANDSIALRGAKNEVVAFQVICENSGSDTARNFTVTLDSLRRVGSPAYTIKNGLTQAMYNENPYDFRGKNIQTFVTNYRLFQGRTDESYVWWSGARPGASKAGVYIDTTWSQGDSAFSWSVPEVLFPRETPPLNRYGQPYPTGQGGFPFFIPDSSNQSIWFDVYIPKDAPAGQYTGTVRIFQDTDQVDTMKVGLRVWNFTLSDTNHTQWMGSISTDPVAKHGLSVGFDPSKQSFWDLYKKYAVMHKQHRRSTAFGLANGAHYRHFFRSIYDGKWFTVDSSKYGAAPGYNTGMENMLIGEFLEASSARKEITGDSAAVSYWNPGTGWEGIDIMFRYGGTGTPDFRGRYHIFSDALGHPKPATLDPAIYSFWDDTLAYRDSLWGYIDTWAKWRDSISSNFLVIQAEVEESGILGGNPSIHYDSTRYARTGITARDSTDADEIYISAADAPPVFLRWNSRYSWVQNDTRSAKARIEIDSAVAGGRIKLRLWRNITGQAKGNIIRIGYLDDRHRLGGDTSAGPYKRILQRWYATDTSGLRIARASGLYTPLWKNIYYVDTTSLQHNKWRQINLVGGGQFGTPVTYSLSTGNTNYPQGSATPYRVNLNWREHRDSVASWKAYGWEYGHYSGARPALPVMPVVDAPAIDQRLRSWLHWILGLTISWDYETTAWGTSHREWRANTHQDGSALIWPGTDVTDDSSSRQLNGPVASIKLKNSRRGIQDMEYMYEAQKLGLPVQEYLKHIGPLYTAQAEGQGRPVAPYPRGWAQYGAIAQRIIDSVAMAVEGSIVALPTGTFAVDQDTLDAGGGKVVFTWTSQNANSGTILPDVGTINPIAGGSVEQDVDSTTMFTLTLYGPSGTTTYSLWVVVLGSRRATGQISVLPDTLTQGGGKVYVTWSTQYADSEIVLDSNRDTLDSRMQTGFATSYVTRTGWHPFTLIFWDYAGKDSTKDSAWVMPVRRVFPGVRR